MLVALADTHARDDHQLRGRAGDAVREADLVVHAGDFTEEPVLDSFHAVADSFRAVHGNRDSTPVTNRLPEALAVEYGGARIVLTHRQRSGDTGLGLLGRKRGADVVVHGHSHRPRVTDAGPVTLLNPGSHAEPRGGPATHAEITAEEAGLDGRIVRANGEVVERFRIDATSETRSE